MKKMLNLLFCGLIMINITGCSNTEKNNEDNNMNITTSTIMITTSDNAILSSDTQYKYQDDWSSTLEVVYASSVVYDEIYQEYGIKNTPKIRSLNDKNLMYEVKLECGNIKIIDCKAAHNKFNQKVSDVIPDLYQLFFEIVDSAN